MGTDIISQSFNDLLNSEPVDGGGFHVEPMNKCIEDAHLLPPLIPLYPDIVLEGDLSIIFGQSGIGKTIFAMQIARYIAEIIRGLRDDSPSAWQPLRDSQFPFHFSPCRDG